MLDSLVKQYFWSLHNQNYVVCLNGCILSSHAYRQGLQNNSFVFTTPGQMLSFSVFWCSNNWDHPKKDFSNDWQQVFWKVVKKKTTLIAARGLATHLHEGNAIWLQIFDAQLYNNSELQNIRLATCKFDYVNCPLKGIEGLASLKRDLLVHYFRRSPSYDDGRACCTL